MKRANFIKTAPLIALALISAAHADTPKTPAPEVDSVKSAKIKDACSAAAHKLNASAIGKIAKKDLSGAAQDFTKSIAACAANPTALANRGQIYWLQKKYDDAIVDMTAALKIEPAVAKGVNKPLASAYLERARQKIDLNQIDQAGLDLQKANHYDENNPFVYSEYAFVLTQYHKYPECIRTASQGIKLNPNLAEAYGNRGSCYTGVGNLVAALNDLNKAIELRALPEFYLQRGSIYSAQNDCTSTKKDLEKAASLKPELREVASKMTAACKQKS